MGKAQDSTTRQERRQKSRKDEERDRRQQSRLNGILSDIEDATYKVLRKHEKKSQPSSRQTR
jgi:hypothetical protein